MTDDSAGGEEVPTFEIGDRVLILGGQRDKTRGRIYYMDGDLIRILPDGVSDRVIDLPLEEGDFAESLGIESFLLLNKAPSANFVALIDAQKDQIAETFGENGELGQTYTIRDLSEAEDTLTLVDETGGVKELSFRGEFHRGIERSEPFVVLRPRQPPSPVVEGNGEAAVVEGEEEADDDFENIEIPEAGEEVEERAVGLVLRSAKDRTYPDQIQRNEMFLDLLERLDIHAQKNPKRQREVRQLVEQLLLLRNTVTEYSDAGDPKGLLPTSYQTVAELLEKNDIPLARPVLDAKRTLHPVSDPETTNPTEIPGAAVELQYLDTLLRESNQFLSTQLGGTTEQILTPDALPTWYLTWEIFFHRYMRTFRSSGSPDQTVSFRGDKEFLRAPAPMEEEPDVDGLKREGAIGKKKRGPARSTAEEEEENETPTDNLGLLSVGKVKLSLLKGTGPRYTRVKANQPQRKIEDGDEGVIVNQLLFPLKTERDLGTTRTGSLARDIDHSLRAQKSLATILTELGGIPEEATAGGILSLGEGGNTAGNIGIDDWLKAQPLHIRGLGDALVQMKSLGLTQKELTTDQQEVLIEKIKTFRALLNQYITKEREESAKVIGGLRLENQTFLQGEALEDILAILSSEPQIALRMEELKRCLPAYKDNDIALIAGVSAQMADLLVTAIAGQPGPLARERNRRVRDTFLETLQKAMMKARKKELEGAAPQPNPCPHVNTLVAIRKIADPTEQMQALAKFITNFKKGRKDNWLQCNSCEYPLLCYHEELLLEEFKHPREKDAIHKELLLGFSSGASHGNYLCKNCGQAISEVDYDRGMEFDENGRAMAAPTGEVDITQEMEDEILGTIVGEGGEEGTTGGFTDETHKLIFRTALKIFDRLGLYPGKDVYKRIVERVEAEIRKQPSREEYARIVKIKAKKGEKALDYDILINRILVSSVGANVIVEIQCHIPDMIPRYRLPGCPAGFSGYPLGREEDKTCINYISCAIAGIKDNTAPWNLTGFQALRVQEKRQEMVSASVLKLVGEAMKTAAVQQLLVTKKAYYEKLYGTGTLSISQIPETIHPGFRPVPYLISPKEAAEAIIVPEAASPVELTRAWIQTAHRIARQNGVYVKDSPFSETTCCSTAITEPRTFWAQKEGQLPRLPSKTAPVGQSSSQTSFRFKPRRMAKLLADPPEDAFYRVFLRVCYDGPRKGLPHEPGYTNRCVHCGFTFPDSPYVEAPAPPLNKELFKEWQAEMDAIITRGKSALESQKVLVNKSTFEDVLDASHRAFRVTVPETAKPLVGTALLAKLGEIEPEPFDGWRRLLSETIARVARLPGGADITEVANAYGPMSDALVDVLSEIQRRIGAPAARALQSLLEKSPSQIVESVRTYFLVVFQRLVVGFKPESLHVLQGYKLPEGVEGDIKKAMESHLGYLNALKKVAKGYTLIKLEQARKQLAVVLPILQKEIRANLVPGGSLGLPYIVGALISGILGEFINPNVIPEGAIPPGYGGAVDTTSRNPLTILEVCLTRLQSEGLSLTDTEIREMIARRVEAEKMTFIGRMDKMTPEEKQMTLRNKRLGLKEWAVGGTKAIYRLDADQYERERAQRTEMGIVNEFTEGDAATQEAMARLYHEEAYGGGGAGAEGGYDVAQMGEDDY